MNRVMNAFIVCTSSFIFISCGSSSSATAVANTPTSLISFSGRVVDGNISGAVLCADVNLNLLCDVDESTTNASTTGYYSFTDLNVTGRDFISLMATGGTDTATNKNLEGQIRKIIDLSSFSSSSMQYVTPLTDLVATSFLNTTTKNAAALQSAKNNTYAVYPVGTSEAYLDENPMAYAGVFGVSQEIQQTKSLMEEIALKTKGAPLTPIELKQLRREIKQAISTQIATDGSKNFINMMTQIENIASISIAQNIKTFFAAQMRAIEIAIGSFTQTSKLTEKNLNDYQAALDMRMGDVVAAVQNAQDANSTITPLDISIDIFADTNTTDTNTTDTNTTETNTTTPAETNTTTISFSGIMADGYISGATVCIDVDFDGTCDNTEPTSITSSDGNFSFSNISIDKNLVVPIVGFGGTDTSTGNSFQGELKNIIAVNEINNSSALITPLSDMVATQFAKSTSKDTAALTTAMSDIANAFGLSSTELMSDPMKSTALFMKSQELQQTRAIVELVMENTLGKSLSSTQKTKIREALLSQIISSGYDNLNVSNVLTLLQADGSFNYMTISDNNKNFVQDQTANIKTTLDSLAQDTNIIPQTLPRLQTMLEDALSGAYANISYTDINLTADNVTYSIFDKAGAVYDESACMKNTYYTNTLLDNNSSDSSSSSDTVFGLTLNFNGTTDVNTSAVNEVKMYYPNLTTSLITTELPVLVSETNYNFTFNTAWITQGATVYIQTPKDSSGYYGCYRVPLTSQTPILKKVYRYTDQ